ncbi:MAG: PotD/PotF family extracellular solute-binding protein [Pseudanabaenaceae cyanobacterium]
MHRRLFLGGLGASLLLTGCHGATATELQVLGLAGAIPGRSLRAFEQKFSKITYKTEANPDSLWKRLQNPENPAQVLSLGDSWLDMAIQRQLIRPFTPAELAQIPNWQKLNRWQEVATRGEQVWGIPYRWGFTGIIYRRDRLNNPIASWADLWRPELARKIILPDDPAEVIGLVLKKLGASYQHGDPLALPDLADQLQALHRQVLCYSSTDYIQPLLIDDADVAVGWSVDLLRAMRQYPLLQVALPTEGTALWADVWVIPKTAQFYPLALAWINSTLDPQFAVEITALTDARSTIDSELIPASVKSDRWKFPDPQVIANSELISRLPAPVRQAQQSIWAKLRRGQVILEENKGRQTMEIIGVIKRLNIGMGVWVLETAQGTTYEIMQPVDAKLLKAGQKVKIKGRERTDLMSVNMVGTMLEVISFSLLGN